MDRITSLQVHGHEAKAVREVGLREANDSTIWAFAEQGAWVAVTKDDDFVERAMRHPGGPQVVWLRIENCGIRVALNMSKGTAESRDGEHVVYVKRLGRKINHWPTDQQSGIVFPGTCRSRPLFALLTPCFSHTPQFAVIPRVN